MATAPIPTPDRIAELQLFLLGEFVRGFHDPRRPLEEQEEARAKLEAFILNSQTPMLAGVQRAFNVSDLTLANELIVLEWFITFVQSLQPVWLREVDLNLAERLWKVTPDRRTRDRAAELITRVELLRPDPLGEAHLSRLVQLFRQVQPEPFSLPLAEGAQSIVDVLLTRAMLSSATMLGAGVTLGRYSLYVLRYCFVDRTGVQIEPAIGDQILRIADRLTADRKDALTAVLAITR